MASISCHCFNVNIQLISPPILTTDQKWLAEQIGTKKVGDAKVKGNGPLMELENLVGTRIVSGWKVYKCYNCNADVCAIDINNTSRALVNMELEERGVNDPHMLKPEGGRFYSSCFRIILDEADSSDPLGVTSKDLQAIDTFNKLQRQVDNFVSAEERVMEKRIRAFIKEQQEAFNVVKSRANKDRAILWRKLCKINSSYGSTQIAPISNSHTSSSSSPVFKIASSAPSSIAPIANKPFENLSPSPKHSEERLSSTSAASTDKGWHPAELAKPLAPKSRPLINSSTDGGIFAFDDDDDDDQESSPATYAPILQLAAKHSSQQEDSSSDSEDAKPSQPQPIDSAKYLASSLPIHILNPSLMNMGSTINRAPPREAAKSFHAPVELEVEIAKVPRESWSSRSEVGEELPAEVAASFAVPTSLNRRIKSLI